MEERMSVEKLARYDGREGRRALVTVGEKIYDFTESSHWKDGDHKGMHRAGCDLTEELKSAPHIRAVIERFPVVGIVETGIVETTPSIEGGGARRKISLTAAVLLALALLVFFFRL